MARFKRERGGGSSRLAKIKKRMEARGRDVSGLDLNALSGFESLDDATLEKLLEVMAGGGPAPAGSDADAPPPRAAAAGGHRAAPRGSAPAADDGEEAAVVDDDGGEL
jgi:hypothetical protein